MFTQNNVVFPAVALAALRGLHTLAGSFRSALGVWNNLDCLDVDSRDSGGDALMVNGLESGGGLAEGEMV